MTRIGQVLGALKTAIHQDTAELERFIFEFVKIPSENPPGIHYRDCRDFSCDWLRKLAFEPIVHALPVAGDEEPAYVVQAFLGAQGPTVHFHGHYDVVPACEPSQFAPVIRNGNMFGRGTADMEAGLGLMLFAAKALRDCRVPLRGRVALTFVPDEETGGVRGSHLLDREGILGRQGIAMFTAEPTGGVVWNGSRGAISLRITVKGKSFHVGEHYKGVNAFEAMLHVANRLVRLKSEVEARQTAYAITPPAARGSVLLIGGTVSGGSNFNVVPDQCSFTVDRRINPEESLEVEEREVLRIIGEASSSSAPLQVEVLQRAPSSGSDADSPIARKLAACADLVLKAAPRFELCPGLLETRFYAQRNIPAFAYGPGLLSVAHGPNEFVSMKKTREFALIHALVAAEILAEPLPPEPAP